MELKMTREGMYLYLIADGAHGRLLSNNPLRLQVPATTRS
jgi:hypothetical protein